MKKCARCEEDVMHPHYSNDLPYCSDCCPDCNPNITQDALGIPDERYELAVYE